VTDAPEPARRPSRGLDMLTAVLLGVVSLTTALGAWQAGIWSQQADWYAESSGDARDAAIIRGVDWQYDNRLDTAAVLNARKFALLEDEAAASGDFVGQAYNNVMVTNQLGRILTDSGVGDAFAAWREAGFPAAESPTVQPHYLVELRGEADSYTIASALAGTFKDALQAKANIFVQAALINALALFLLGVAGINRLRAARFATLVLGAAAYFAALVLMATAY
jgi:hypothetical protein